jgi:hypothetical protein
MQFCKHKDIFGKPREGPHSARIPGIDVATTDTMAVLIIGYLISWYSGYSYWKITGGLFVAGIVVHRLFCVRTKLDSLLFPNYG